MKKLGVLILIFLGIFFLSESVQADVANGLVAYYPFNGNANDESGNGYDGIVNGATLTEDQFGNVDSAYEFDGSNSNINLGDNFDTYQSMTIAAWVYLKSPVDNSGDPFTIVGKMNQTNGKTFSLYWVPNGTYFSLRFYGNPSCTSDSCWVGGTSEVTFFEERWHFVAGTFENGTAKLYVNGELERETNSSLSIVNTSNDTVIGSYSDDRAYFHGKIDDVRIYNRALSDSEIQELYNKGSSSEQNISGLRPSILLLLSNDTGTTTNGTCGAYVAPGVWKEFDCYNLAAIGKTRGDDPFTPSWSLIGGYWQWGRKGPGESKWYDTNTSNFAHGPTGSDETDANDGEIDGWDTSYAEDGAWSDDDKTSNDPCPSGYRVPTQTQWKGVSDNNTQTLVGTWSDNAANYSSGRFYGDGLMLPAAGRRYYSSNGVLEYRGQYGLYWSSTKSSVYNDSSCSQDFGSSDSFEESSYHHRWNGLSVRCIAE